MGHSFLLSMPPCLLPANQVLQAVLRHKQSHNAEPMVRPNGTSAQQASDKRSQEWQAQQRAAGTELAEQLNPQALGLVTDIVSHILQHTREAALQVRWFTHVASVWD